jgi:hypothetical protein
MQIPLAQLLYTVSEIQRWSFERPCLHMHKRHHTECCIFTALRAVTSNTAHHCISQDMSWEFLVQHFLEDGLALMVQFCGHLGTST